MKESAFIGIDPGVTGAACCITNKQIQYHDWKSGVEACGQLEIWHCQFTIRSIRLEHVWGRAGDQKSAVRMMKLIGNARKWEGILIGLKYPYKLITPQAWKRTVGIRPRSEKNASVEMVRKRWPQAGLWRNKDNNRADAFLMAWCGYLDWDLERKRMKQQPLSLGAR